MWNVGIRNDVRWGQVQCFICGIFAPHLTHPSALTQRWVTTSVERMWKSATSIFAQVNTSCFDLAVNVIIVIDISVRNRYKSRAFTPQGRLAACVCQPGNYKIDVFPHRGARQEVIGTVWFIWRKYHFICISEMDCSQWFIWWLVSNLQIYERMLLHCNMRC